MIIVLADDFSGAAEMAGIAWRSRLNVQLSITTELAEDIDVLVIDTDTRSKSNREAGIVHQSLSKILKESNIEWIFKKTDSVLRGHIITEIESLLGSLGTDKVLLIANNPSSGRKIRNEHYYINDIELHRSDFRNDPDFPVKTSRVRDILGPSKNYPLIFVDKYDKLDKNGIFIPEIVSTNDIDRWASSIGNDIIPAGGSDFFEALLKFKGLHSSKGKLEEITQVRKKCFIVSGSSTEQSKYNISKLRQKRVPICSLPVSSLEDFNFSETVLKSWVNQIVESFNSNNMVMSTVLKPLNKISGFPKKLNAFISKMVENVLNQVDIDLCIVEGGSTMSHLARSLGWRKFIPVSEYTKGVVELKIEEKSDCRLIVKPGSYPWPEELIKY